MTTTTPDDLELDEPYRAGGRRVRRAAARRELRHLPDAAHHAAEESEPAPFRSAPISSSQQLVEFASVEQQVNLNTNLQTLISMQQTLQSLQVLQLVGQTITVNCNTAALSNATGNSATWTFVSPSPATDNVAITNSSGQVVLTRTISLSAGNQTYAWGGKGNNGLTWPDGNYTLSINATGANGQAVTVTTEVQAK